MQGGVDWSKAPDESAAESARLDGYQAAAEASRVDTGPMWDNGTPVSPLEGARQWLTDRYGNDVRDVSWKTKDGVFETQSSGKELDPRSLTRAPSLDAGFGFPRPEDGSVQAFTTPDGGVLYKVSQAGRSEYFEPSAYGLSTDGSYNDAESRRLSNYPTPATAVAKEPVQRVEIVGQRMTFAEARVYDSQQLAMENLPPYHGFVETHPLLAEVIGAQSLPGTVDGLKDVYQGGVAAFHGGWQATQTATGSRIVGPIRGGTQPIIVINTAPKPGMPMVMALPAAPAPSLFAQVGSAAVSGARNAPGLSLAGTGLEYGLYSAAGQSEAARKSSVTDFVVDATLDLQKGVVAGWAGAATGAAAGAAVGSVFPIVGSAVGALVGLAAGVGYAYTIEWGYTQAGTRDHFKNLADGK